MNSRPFVIYRSSAGSGKTYTLTLSFLQLALANPAGFHQILGVTFTNKATAEMKSRIIDVLTLLSKGEEHPMSPVLCTSLGITLDVLQKRSQELLSRILHRYGQFSVSTIDSFFNQVIRNFAREIGLQGSFTIRMDTDNILQMVVDELLGEVGRDDKTYLKRWLTEYAGKNIEDGGSWDFKKSILKLSAELLNESFKQFGEGLLTVQPKDFYAFQSETNKVIKGFEQRLIELGEEGILLVERSGGVDQFSRKKSGPAGLFYGAAAGEIKLTDTRKSAKDQPENWLTKKQLSDSVGLYQVLEDVILPKYGELVDFIENEQQNYHTAIASQKYLYTLGILAEVNRYLQRYRDEHDVMLIPDLTEFLRKIIRDSDTPYIYEKIGTRYQHFLLDEFQDTSGFQWDNFRPLIQNAVSAGMKSMVVGDVKQSIYRWRGGDWQLLQSRIGEDLKGFEEVQRLAANYRSGHEIVAFNNQLFQKLISSHHEFFDISPDDSDLLDRVSEVYADIQQEPQSVEKGGKVQLRFIEEEDWKKQAVLEMIQEVEALQRAGYPLRDMAILTRTKSEGKQVVQAFFEYATSQQADPAVSYDVVSSEALFLDSHPVVALLLSLLRWLQDESDDIVLAEWVRAYGMLNQLDRPSSWRDWEAIVPKEFVDQRRALCTLPVYELVEAVIRLLALAKYKDAYAYLQGFQDAILDFSKHEKNDLSNFLAWWETHGSTRSIQVSEDNQAIRILTIHKSKGLEFPIVFLPFMNWPLDHQAQNELILWLQPPAQPPYNSLPVVPVRYIKDLANTLWSRAYWEERFNAYLDAINLLYVAVTRPVAALYGFAPFREKSKGVGDVSKLLHVLLSDTSQYSHESMTYQVGHLPNASLPKDTIKEKRLQDYQSYAWRDRLQLQLRTQRQEVDDVHMLQPEDPRQRGILIHDLVDRIYDVQQLATIEGHPLYQEVAQLIRHREVIPYFEDLEEVKTEASILLPGGEVKRLDRLVKKANQWIVIDFKTGQQRKEHDRQLVSYMQTLREMDYQPISGRLIYLDPVHVKEVVL